MEHDTSNIESFNKLYQDYQPRFVRFANSYVHDLALAEDITTEAMIYYWENRSILTEESDIPAYILTVVKHKCLNQLRHQHIHDEYSEQIAEYYQWELDMRINLLEECEPHELLQAEIIELLKQALDDMPEKTRKVFMLSRYENKTYKEIAAMLNITPKGVDFHISKALKCLRAHLKDYFPLFLYFFLKSH